MTTKSNGSSDKTGQRTRILHVAVPLSLLNKIKKLARKDARSINSKSLLLLKKAVQSEISNGND
jgi:hypothetical protein